jgi:hypothetical protein
MSDKPKRTRKPRDPNAPKVKRPRSGTWTKISRQISIPVACRDEHGDIATDPDTADLDMYRVEFKGETLEVQRNRAGVKKGNDWIRAIKSRAKLELKIYRIRLKLVDLSSEATGGLAERLNQAARMLEEQT